MIGRPDTMWRFGTGRRRSVFLTAKGLLCVVTRVVMAGVCFVVSTLGDCSVTSISMVGALRRPIGVLRTTRLRSISINEAMATSPMIGTACMSMVLPMLMEVDRTMVDKCMVSIMMRVRTASIVVCL